MTRGSLLRVIDANTNRALEGMRVCEDLVRFHLVAPRLFQRTRALRHAIAKAVRRLPVDAADLARARDSRNDVGRRARAARIGSLEQLLIINLQRVKEALRTLEESTRLLAPHHTNEFQRLRFRTYEVERELLLLVAKNYSGRIGGRRAWRRAEARGVRRPGMPGRKRRATTARTKPTPPNGENLWGGAISGRLRRHSSSTYRPSGYVVVVAPCSRLGSSASNAPL